MRTNYIALSLAAVISTGMGVAQAQEANNELVLEEVLVTATKRETTEMSTSISIETISGDQIENRNMVNIDDISAFLPNVDIANGLTQATVTIRGIGSGQERSFEQSVAMFIDGVYMPRSRQYRAPFFDMERVEVLRGPQSVLFGLNATAGTVNITSASNRPGDEAFARFVAGYETEYGGYSGEVVAGGGGENVGFRIAARYRDTGDGFYHNTFTGQDENSTEEKLVRASLVWEASKNLSITAKLNFADAVETGDTGEAYGPTAAALAGDGKLDWVRNVDSGLTGLFTDKPAGFDHETMYGLVSFDYQMGDYTLTGVASYSSDEFEYVVGTAQLPLPTFANYLVEDFEQTSFEIRLASPTDRRVSFLAGIYYGDTELNTSLQTAVGGPLFFGAPVLFHNQYLSYASNQTLSPFASFTFNVSDTFRIIAGARYSDQDKDSTRDRLDCYQRLYDGDTNPVLATFPDAIIDIAGLTGLCGSKDRDGDFSSSNFMPELAVQWDYGENSMAYAKWGESVKAGGLTFSDIPSPIYSSYGDETATGFEIGSKSRLMDGRAELSIALFHTKFDDMQLNSFIPHPDTGIPVTIVRNAGSAINKGIEAEFNIAATSWLTLGASLGYLDSSFDDFDNGPCYAGEDEDGSLPGTCAKTGLDTPNSPRWSGSAYADIAIPVGSSLEIIGGINMGYSDDYFTEGSIDPAAVQGSYTRWDARIGIAQAGGKWSVAVIGKNLSNEVVNSFTQPLVGNIGYIGAPRTITLQGIYSF